MNEEISACRFLKVEGSYMRVSTVLQFRLLGVKRFIIIHPSLCTDFREFICSLSVTTRGSPEEKLRWAFGIYDIDGNGYVTKTEILSIVQSIQKMVGALDANASEEKLHKIFTMFDTNRDGKLSLAEFIEGAKKDSTFMQMLQVYV